MCSIMLAEPQPTYMMVPNHANTTIEHLTTKLSYFVRYPFYHLEIITEALLPSFVMKNENKDKQEKKCEESLDFEYIC
jgi:hypothetical protein